MGDTRPTNPSIDPDPRPPQPPTTEPGSPPDEPRAAGQPPAPDQEREAGSTTGRARERASQGAQTARQQTGRMADEAASQGRRVLDDATGELRRQADAKTHDVASSLHDLGQEGHALIEGRPDDAPQAQRYLRQAADTVSRAGDRVDELGVDGMVDEVGRFARRRPAAFVFAAAAAGFVVGRMLRNAGGAQQGEPQPRGDGQRTPSPSDRDAPSQPGTAEPSLAPPPPEPTARSRGPEDPGAEAARSSRSGSSDTDVLP